MDGVGSALRWRTFDDDGELTMAVLSMDDLARICSQSPLLSPVGEDRGRGKRCDLCVFGGVLSLAHFSRGGEIRHGSWPPPSATTTNSAGSVHLVFIIMTAGLHTEMIMSR